MLGKLFEVWNAGIERNRLLLEVATAAVAYVEAPENDPPRWLDAQDALFAKVDDLRQFEAAHPYLKPTGGGNARDVSTLQQ